MIVSPSRGFSAEAGGAAMCSKRFLSAAALIVTFYLGTPAATAETPLPRVVACNWIKTVSQLQAMKNNLAGTYCSANDIDASAKANFVPNGTAAAPFTGRLFGNGHVIGNLSITSAAAAVGLFGFTNRAVIQDVDLIKANIH